MLPSSRLWGVLHAACRALKAGTAAGIDGWPPEAIRSLPSSAMPTLAMIFAYCEAHAIWPAALMYVRAQMIPKEDTTSRLMKAN